MMIISFLDLLVQLLPRLLDLFLKLRLLGHHSCEPKVTNHNIALRVNQEIGRFDISVDDIGRVNIAQGAETVV